jgi:hypothetical protein
MTLMLNSALKYIPTVKPIFLPIGNFQGERTYAVDFQSLLNCNVLVAVASYLNLYPAATSTVTSTHSISIYSISLQCLTGTSNPPRPQTTAGFHI